MNTHHTPSSIWTGSGYLDLLARNPDGIYLCDIARP